ncbi:ribosomal L7Ae/L30e/S12e/Gadd45 family protein [Marine Group I thaumarchaeote]|uniref:Ribosomal L7Ae/L30e/S12e/Gadd45 family protein n=1 Tax=Marine Group I thaumarchaeote TaxID=2511932 RepID=A0A7K4NVG4_9ARCH|nr:ribosomal L7Ae/L30e/S12e/Gadd45 family protein [Marine Group I thaumarchaeote]
MAKLLEKALTDAIKERKRTLGTKQIISSMKNSKLVVISQSVPGETSKKIEESAQNDNVPLLHFNDTSVALGKLCGLQFRVSAISLSSLSNTNIQAILKEYEKK